MKQWILALALLGACSSLTCETAAVDVYALDGKPKPAGRVVVQCNGKAVVELKSQNVQVAP